MFDAYLMIRADDRTLEQAPNAFNAVGMNITNYPFFRRVIHPTMFRVGILNPPISRHFVGVDRFRVSCSDVMDELMQRGLVGMGDNLQPNLASPVDCSD